MHYFAAFLYGNSFDDVDRSVNQAYFPRLVNARSNSYSMVNPLPFFHLCCTVWGDRATGCVLRFSRLIVLLRELLFTEEIGIVLRTRARADDVLRNNIVEGAVSCNDQCFSI